MGRVHWLAVYLYCYSSSVVAVNRQCYDEYCFIKPDPLTSGDVQKTFTDAQQWCRNNSAVLLEIPDEHVQAAVRSYYTDTDNAFTLNPFLNAKFQQTDWRWADGTPYNSSWGGAIQTNARYAYIKFDLTNNRFGISSATVWDTTTKAFICQYSGDQCPSGASGTDGLCIGLNTSSSSWFEARLSCYRQGGDLASLHNLHMNSSSLANKLQSQTEYWIGLTNGQWSWQDSGTHMVYNNWQHGSPGSLTCLCLFNRDGSWMDCGCGAPIRPFICLQNAISTSTPQNPSPGMSTSKSSHSQTTSTSKSSSQTTSFSKSSNETPSTSKSSKQTSTSESSSQTTSTMTFSNQGSTSKLSNETVVSPMTSSNQTRSIGVAVGVSVGIILLILIILAILLIVFRRRCRIGSLLRKPRESGKSKEIPVYQDAAYCLPPADVLPPGTAFSNITYSSPNDDAQKVGPYEAIHSSDNIYSEPDHDDGNKYSEVSFNPTDVEAGAQPAVEYMELCDDAGVDETAPHEGVASGNAVVQNNPYDNFVKQPVNPPPSIELTSPLRTSGSNDDTILIDNELYS